MLSHCPLTFFSIKSLMFVLGSRLLVAFIAENSAKEICRQYDGVAVAPPLGLRLINPTLRQFQESYLESYPYNVSLCEKKKFKDIFVVFKFMENLQLLVTCNLHKFQI